MQNNCLDFRFKSSQQRVNFDAVDFVCKMADNMLMVHTKKAAKIQPGAGKPKHDVLITCHVPYVLNHMPDTLPVHDCSSLVVSSVCGRYNLYCGTQRIIMVFQSSITCFCTEHVKAVVIQRTRGGMNTFDAVLLATNVHATVEFIAHHNMEEFVRALIEDYGIHVCDAGPDPVGKRDLDNAIKTDDTLRAFIASFDESAECSSDSDEPSEWEAGCTDSSESYVSSTDTEDDIM